MDRIVVALYVNCLNIIVNKNTHPPFSGGLWEFWSHPVFHIIVMKM